MPTTLVNEPHLPRLRGAPTNTGPRKAAADGDSWRLTGRAEELGIVEAALFDPDLSGIVLSGIAGVGKSRLAQEALHVAASKGAEVRWVVATSSARGIPLGAFASWVASDVANSLQLVRGVIDSLIAAPPGTPVVIGVDDVDLLDDLSAFVLHQIVQRRGAKVVLTHRDGVPIPPGVQEVWKAGQFDRLDLQQLSEEEVLTVVSAALGGSLDPGAGRRLWKLTRGNALYLRNIVEQEVADGRLAEEHGYWRWSGDLMLPPGLIEHIESRIGALPTLVADVIDTLAIGEPIDLASLTRITDAAAIEEAESRGLIVLDQIEGVMSVRIAHPLYGEVRRKRAPSTKLRRLRGLVAAELAASDDRDDMRVVMRRATLSLDSDAKPDTDLLVRAASSATWLMELPLADRLAHAAIRSGGSIEAKFIRAYVLSWLNRGEEADAVLSELRMDDLNDAESAMLLFIRATNRLFTLADPAGAKALADGVSTTKPLAQKSKSAFLAVYWAAMGKPELARVALEGVTLSGLPDIIARLTAWAITVSAGEAGRTSEAVAAAQAGYPIPVRAFATIADGHVGALLLAGRIREARDVVEWLRARLADVPMATQLVVDPTAGRAALGAGRLETACSLLRPMADMLDAVRETNWYSYRYRISLTIALAMRGVTDNAAASLAVLEAQQPTGWQYLDYEIGLARAWVAGCQGAVSEAAALSRSAAETARANGQFAAEVLCLQTAAQFGDGASGHRLHELAVIVEGPRAAVAADFADALNAGDGAELETRSREFEQMGDLIAAVDAAAHAALVFRSQGLRGSALGCSTRADTLAERCGASTPVLRRASERLPLTDREREIVMLIAQGLSNREVAARLTLSVRTVESHLYRAMAKTGTTTRDELAALIRRSGSESHN